MTKLVDLYLESKELSWSPATFDSEAPRLKKLIRENEKRFNDPSALYKKLLDQGKKPYSIKTSFIRLADFTQWLIENGYKDDSNNHFQRFITKHGNLFKNAYVKENLEITYEEALKRIDSLGCREIREKAYQLLQGGLRFTESLSLSSGHVKGKGGRRRRVFVSKQLQSAKLSCSYHTFWRALKEIGLKPHMLRKLAATKWAESGADTFKIMQLGGWKSVQTAAGYIQDFDQNTLQEFAEECFKEKVS